MSFLPKSSLSRFLLLIESLPADEKSTMTIKADAHPNQAPPFELDPPADTRTGGRIRYYGYNVSRPWLVELGLRNWHYARPDLEQSLLTLILHALELLRHLTGIKNLTLQGAFVDEATPEDAFVWEDRQVPLLAICSWDRESYRSRPAQECVDKLTKILEAKPRWWIDGAEAELYLPQGSEELARRQWLADAANEAAEVCADHQACMTPRRPARSAVWKPWSRKL